MQNIKLVLKERVLLCKSDHLFIINNLLTDINIQII